MVELFDGVVRFNPYTMFINIALIIFFLYDWIKLYKEYGLTLDYWTMTMSLSYVFPFLIMYPFAGSIYNVFAVGNNISLIQNNIEFCYYVSLLGYMSMYLGRYIYDLKKGSSIINMLFIKPFKNSIGKLFLNTVKSKYTSIIVCCFYFFGLLLILIFARTLGDGDVRGIFQANPALRALYNFILILSSIVSLVLIARIFQYNTVLDKVLIVMFFGFTLFIGARAFLGIPIINLFGFYVFLYLKGKINLLKVVVVGGSVMFLGIGLSLVRSGDFSASGLISGFGMQVFYGNSFSDLRDFAWVNGYWDKDLLFGKTYLAGFMSFVPSYFSEFRTQWAAGRFTAITVGFDPLEHPGLRPGLFGESFFNFGLIGVSFLGTLLGYAYRYIDFQIKRASISKTSNVIAISSLVSTMFISNLTITSGFFSVYVFIVVLISSAILSRIFSAISN